MLGDVIIYDTAYEQDGQTWHRLRAGFFNTRAEALAASERYSVLFPDSWVAKVDSQERLQGVVTRRHGPSPDSIATQSAPRAVLTAEQQQLMQANVAGAEEALRLNDADRAISLLTEAMALPENDLTPRALELLGLARERKGQSAHAIAEYDEYLRRYPNGEAAGRVKQRLAALSSPGVGTPEALRPSSSGVASTAEAWRWDVRGSFSQFYFRDQSRVTTINATPADPNADADIQNNVNLNQLLTSADITLIGGNDRNQITMRASGSYSKNFDAGTDDRKSVSALYVDFNDKELGLSGRFGRQTRNSAGVFGRFDGALLGVQAKPRLRFNAVAGFPVRSSRNVYVDKQAYFYGLSADYGARNDKVQGTVYWFDQRAKGGLIDRRSVGGEVRYLNKKFNAFALVDYDIHFGEVDLALFTMNYTFPDKSSIGVTADYRRSPLLTTRNAMIGQFGHQQPAHHQFVGPFADLYRGRNSAIGHRPLVNREIGNAQLCAAHFGEVASQLRRHGQPIWRTTGIRRRRGDSGKRDRILLRRASHRHRPIDEQRHIYIQHSRVGFGAVAVVYFRPQRACAGDAKPESQPACALWLPRQQSRWQPIHAIPTDDADQLLSHA